MAKVSGSHRNNPAATHIKDENGCDQRHCYCYRSCCPSLQVREIVVSQSEAKKLYCAILPWLEYDASFVIAWMLLMTTDGRRR